MSAGAVAINNTQSAYLGPIERPVAGANFVVDSQPYFGSPSQLNQRLGELGLVIPEDSQSPEDPDGKNQNGQNITGALCEERNPELDSWDFKKSISYALAQWIVDNRGIGALPDTFSVYRAECDVVAPWGKINAGDVLYLLAKFQQPIIAFPPIIDENTRVRLVSTSWVNSSEGFEIIYSVGSPGYPLPENPNEVRSIFVIIIANSPVDFKFGTIEKEEPEQTFYEVIVGDTPPENPYIYYALVATSDHPFGYSHGYPNIAIFHPDRLKNGEQAFASVAGTGSGILSFDGIFWTIYTKSSITNLVKIIYPVAILPTIQGIETAKNSLLPDSDLQDSRKISILNADAATKNKIHHHKKPLPRKKDVKNPTARGKR